MSSRLTFIIITVLSGLLLCINVALQRRNTQLVERIRYLEQSNNGPAEGSLIHSVFGTDFSKQPLVVDYAKSDEPSLLLIFSPFCKYSRQNWPNWERLQSRFPSTKVVFADITGEVSQQFFDSLGIKPPTQTLRLADVIKVQNNLNLTPVTVVVGSKGIVKRTVLGVLDDASLQSVESALKADSRP